MSKSLASSPKLLDRLRNRLRLRQYSWMTEQAYVGWIERYLRFHKDRNGGTWKHPSELRKAEIEQFLTFLAVNRKVAPSTQNQAFSAILFLYQQVLEMETSRAGPACLPQCRLGRYEGVRLSIAARLNRLVGGSPF